MSRYIKNLNRIEFVITYSCTGQCKHCSEGDHDSNGIYIDGDTAVELVEKVAKNYKIESIMTFGGEPLLHPDVVCKIHAAARDMGIPKRQLITNGFFSHDTKTIQNAAHMLVENGVNDILLSVDAFHQETIPLEPVITFAKAVFEADKTIIRVHPAWLVSETADNPYNSRTKEILAMFQDLGIAVSDGNVIFPSGNALKYLKEYFDQDVSYINPYDEDPEDIRTISISPNGDVLGDNIYKTDIIEILENYRSV